jgi:hypothetical protein
MPRIELTINSDLFDITPQDASVRENLPVRILINETRKEFNLMDDAVYSMRVENTKQTLDPDKSLEQQGVATGAKLTFVRDKRAPVREAAARGNSNERQPIRGAVQGLLREKVTDQLFEIAFQPAIVGRPDPTNTQTGNLLAVNLGTFEGAKSVSRYHARLTEDDGQFFLESLADHNPAFLNGSIVRVGEKRVLIPGDMVGVGKITLVFSTRGNTLKTNSPKPSEHDTKPGG